MLLLILGYIITLLTWGWLTVIAFRESLLQGILFMLIPFYAAYYIITRWAQTREPFVIHLIGWICFFIGL